ncbi:MAG: hypothetical protein HGJ94_14105 [Desulfosarcina sp.]|nr:hypothetical protein [Desulfosarcina sp.]MBC2741535.1 hypothetical protein [Desulfosarcina sp.]MBC2764449.1 hypothetical protein [Desulfosarcina sp.]
MASTLDDRLSGAPGKATASRYFSSRDSGPSEFDKWLGGAAAAESSKLKAQSEGYDVPGGMKTFVRGLALLPRQTAAKLLGAIQGMDGASVTDKGWADRQIERARSDADAFAGEVFAQYGNKKFLPGISIQDVAQLPQNLAYSGVTAAGGLTAGGLTAMTPAGPIGGYAVGTGVTGSLAYRMASFEIMQEALEAKEEAFQLHLGRGMTPAEEAKYKKDFASAAGKHGLWEAVPEAIGGAVGFKILSTPLKKMVGDRLATRIVGKLAGVYGEELVTETITEKGQRPLRTELDLPGGGEVGWMEAFKEVAPQTILLTTVMGGAVGAGSKAYDRYVGDPRAAQIVREGVAEGLYQDLPDGPLSKVIERANALVKRYPRDTALKESVDRLNSEWTRRRQKDPGGVTDVRPSDNPMTDTATMGKDVTEAGQILDQDGVKRDRDREARLKKKLDVRAAQMLRESVEEDEKQQAIAERLRAEVGGRRTEDLGLRTEAGAGYGRAPVATTPRGLGAEGLRAGIQRTEDGGRRTEDLGLRTEAGAVTSELRGGPRVAPVRSVPGIQKSEAGSQESGEETVAWLNAPKPYVARHEAINRDYEDWAAEMEKDPAAYRYNKDNSSDMQVDIGVNQPLGVEAAIGQLFIYDDAVQSNVGRLKKGGRAGHSVSSKETLRTQWFGQQIRQAIRQWKADFPQGWSDYQARQKALRDLKPGDLVVTPVGSTAEVLRINKKTVSVKLPGGNKTLLYPEALQRSAVISGVKGPESEVRSQKSEEKTAREPWQIPKAEYLEGTKDEYEASIRRAAHANHVKKAVQDGKDVPAEVLEAYSKNYWAEKALEAKAKPADRLTGDISAIVSEGDGGVSRISYTDNGVTIGTARLMGKTIGDIEVEEEYRRKGYGLKIVEDLVARGGQVANAVTDASKSLFDKAGFATADGSRYTVISKKFKRVAPEKKPSKGPSRGAQVVSGVRPASKRKTGLTAKGKQELTRLRHHLENKGAGWVTHPDKAYDRIDYKIIQRGDYTFAYEKVANGVRETLGGVGPVPGSGWTKEKAAARALDDAKGELTVFLDKKQREKSINKKPAPKTLAQEKLDQLNASGFNLGDEVSDEANGVKGIIQQATRGDIHVTDTSTGLFVNFFQMDKGQPKYKWWYTAQPKDRAHGETVSYEFKLEFEARNRRSLESLSYIGNLVNREELPNKWVRVTYQKIKTQEKPVPPKKTSKKILTEKRQDLINKVAPKKAAEMSPDDLMAEWDRQAGSQRTEGGGLRTEGGGLRTEETVPATPGARAVAGVSPARAKAVETKKHLSNAVDAFKQINAILGDTGAVGPDLDPKKWELIRPLLKTAWDEVVAAGKSGAEFVALALKNLSPAGRPYFEKFVREEVGDGTVRQPTEAAPEGVPAGDVQEPDEGRGSGEVLPDEGRGGRAQKDGDDRQRDAGLHGRRDRDQGPADGVDYIITAADHLGAGGPKQKYRNNVAAIRLLTEIGERPATPEEQSVFARYVGWGGLPQAFPRPDGSIAKGWDAETSELSSLLSPDDYAAARRSTQDAHYTSETVVGGIYDAVRRLGFKAGKIIEPSVGTGNFIGLMPGSIRGRSNVTGIELDPITAAIADKLYPRQRIVNAGFETVTIVPGSFDLAIGNPPFGDQKLFDAKHPELKSFSIHNFFFAKSLIGLRPNGILAMVVSSSMMDKIGDTQRQWIDDRAELIGAIRLPNNAFKSTAGTEVTADILFLRRRMAEEPPGGRKWLALKPMKGAHGSTYRVNEYFTDHPEMVLGDPVPNKLHPGEVVDGVYQGVAGFEARPGVDLAEAIDAAITYLPEDIYRTGQTVDEVQRPEILVSDVGFALPYGYTLDDAGNAVRRLPDENGETVFEPLLYSGKPLAGVRLARFKGLMTIRDAVRRLIRAEVADESESTVDSHRKSLNRVYDAFVAAHGLISTPANSGVIKQDPTDLPLLRSLEEKFDPGISKLVGKRTGETPRAPSAAKAAIFRVRTREPYRQATKAADAKEGLAIVLREDGFADMDRIAALTGKKMPDVAAELSGIVFLDPAAGVYETADTYLSGNVKKKLVQAREAALRDRAFDANVKALEKVLPEDVPPDLIWFAVGATWVPTHLYEQFAAHVLEREVAVNYFEGPGVWSIDAQDGTSPYDTDRMRAVDIFAAMLQSRDIAVYDRDSDGKRVFNMDATTAAQSKAMEINRAFQEWVLSAGDRREALAKTFNDKVNTTVEARFDGSHMIFPGMGIITAGVPRDNQLMHHQKSVVWRLIQKGKGLVDHVVGSGKTFLSISAGLEMKRMGLIKKPMYVVPNHLVGQWAMDFQRLYPGANVLVVNKADFTKKKRQEFLGRIATGDWDAVVVAHSSFGFIKMPAAYERRFYADQVRQYEYAITELTASEGKKSRTVKDMEKAKDKLKAKMDALANRPRDAVVDFSELGVDALFVDEAHEFKNLFYATKRTRVAGLGNQKGSKKAFDMFVKTQYVQESNNGKGVFFLTGTPVSNSISEMYTMMRYLEYGRMQEMGIRHFDQWATMFASSISDWEVDPTGTRYRLQTKMEFVNLPGLMAFYKDFADVVSTRDLRSWAEARGQVWPIPDIKGGKPATVVAERSDLQEGFMRWIVHRFDNMPRDPREDNPLKATGEAMKAALDIRLINEALPDHPGSKVNMAVDRIAETYRRWDDQKGTQLVFCDLSVPKKSRGRHAAEIKALRIGIRDLEKKLESVTDEDELSGIEADYSRLVDKIEKYSPAELMAADSSFSVYDDLKAKLMATGIPEAEIAFIHDANTDLQKEDLFGRVRTGRVRVMIGSTGKMGAGMNVQNKLVALHHLDAPWRPSDLEQREGRIVRQGNEFYQSAMERGETFAVDIYRYATKETLDTRRWQIIERKARNIEQLRAGDLKWGEVISDATSEAANAAEMKAASSGNPLILKEIQVRKALEKLEAQQRADRAKRFSMEAKRKVLATFEANYQDYLDDLESDRKLVAAHPRDNSPQGWSVTLDGTEYKAKGLVDVPAKYTGEDKAEKAAAAKAEKAAEEHNATALKRARALFYTEINKALEPYLKKTGFQQDGVTLTLRGVEFDVTRGKYSDYIYIEPALKSSELYESRTDGRFIPIYEVDAIKKEGLAVEGLLVRLNNLLGKVVNQRDDVVRALDRRMAEHRREADIAERELGKEHGDDGRIDELRREHESILRELQTATASAPSESRDFSMWERGGVPQYAIVKPAGHEVTLADVQAVFKGQDVGISVHHPDRFWVRLKSGQGLEIKKVRAIAVDRVAIEAAYGQMAEDGGMPSGKYQDGKIELTRDIAGKWTLAHEAEHAFEDLGIINRRDVAVLKRHIRQLAANGKWTPVNADDIGGKEDRASWMAAQLEARAKHRGPVARIVEKVRDLLARLVNLVTRTARGIVADVETGRIVEKVEGRRAELPAAAYERTGIPQYSIVNRPQSGPEITSDLDKGRTFVNRLHEMGDEGRYNISVMTATLQEAVQQLAGKPSKKRFHLGLGYRKDVKESLASRRLDRAMLFYRDVGGDVSKFAEFREQAQRGLDDGTIKGARAVYVRQVLRDLDVAEKLSDEQAQFVDQMAGRFEDAFDLARKSKTVQSHVDNYVRRIYKTRKDESGTEETYSGSAGAGHGFKVHHGAAMKRKYDTALDAILDGYELAVEGITSSFESYMSELSTVLANKAFIQKGVNTKDAAGRSLFTTNTSSVAGFEDYRELKAAGFAAWQVTGSIEARDVEGMGGVLETNSWGKKVFITKPEFIPESWAVYKNATTRNPSKVFYKNSLYNAKEAAEQWATEHLYTRIERRDARETAKEFQQLKLWAPAPIADMINRMTATEQFFSKVPGFQTLNRLNAGIKSWILMSSFFHHLAGARSWIFGVHHGWGRGKHVVFSKDMGRVLGEFKDLGEAKTFAETNEGVAVEKTQAIPMLSYKSGLDKINDLHPLISMGVKNGLTLGELQDWAENELRKEGGLTERLVKKMGWDKAARFVAGGRFMRERWANSLFKKFFAGLKAEAFAVEYAHELAKAQERWQSGKDKTAPDPDRIAENVARFINADFGGLHLKRMGRHPTLQALGRLGLLAPDWTESNFRTVSGMIPGLNDKISKMVGDVPPPKGMETIYRKFWGRVMLRITVSTIIAQVLLNGMDDSEEFVKEQALGNRWNKFRWTELDITKLYQAMGIDTEGHRKTFSLGGHFFDPLKLLDPFRLIKGKSSPAGRAATAAFSGSDWAERPFTGAAELIATGRTVKKSSFERKEGGMVRLPSVVVNQVTNMQPIQVGHFLRYWQGEEDGLTALLHSIGAGTHTAWKPMPDGPVTAAAGDAVTDEIERLSDLDLLNSGPPSRTVMMAGIPRKMKPAQYETYLSRSSDLVGRKADGLVRSGRYRRMSDAEKARTIVAIVRNARQRVRKKIKREMARAHN